MTRQCIVFVLLVWLGPAAPASETRMSYVDDADGRRLARIGFERVRDGSATRLRLVVSATGAEVEPVLGLEGVGGANRFTAEQLERVLEGSRRLTVLSRSVETGEQTLGNVRAGRRGFISVRATRADGTIDYLASWPRELPLELVIETGSMQAGRYETEIRVDGHARARLLSAAGPDGTRVLRFESLGAGGPAAAPPSIASRVHFLTHLAPADDAKKKGAGGVPAAPPLGLDLTDWAKRDMEGKWALYQRRLAEAPETRAAWTSFLAAEKEFALLEWIALYQVDGFSSQGAGRALFEADAPQWARVALWCRNNSSGYGDFEGVSLFNARPGVVLWWLRKHPQAAAEMPGLLKQLEDAKTQPVEAPHLLPPLKADEVLAQLNAPAEVVPFGERTSAELGRTYEQQVTRAIRGLIVSGRTDAPWAIKLLALTRHLNAAVRREAYLAYTYRTFNNLAWEDALRTADDAREPAPVREAAAAAFSYADEGPAVYVHLNRIAADVGHPAWSAAVSRLGDIGDGFARDRLSLLAHLPPHGKRLVGDSVKRINSRLERAAAMFKGAADANASREIEKHLADRLVNAAWAAVRRQPVADVLLPWTRETTRKQAAEYPTVRAALQRIADGTAAPVREQTVEPAVQERAGALAREMLP